MESQEFIVLYTHQKMKKSKVWQDGILKIPHLGNKAVLYDDKGQCLESLFLKCLEVNPGDDLESDRYLITVEEARGAGSKADHQHVHRQVPRPLMSSGRSLGCQPAGLKRKSSGFQGPRQVPKKMVIMDNGESTASLEAADPGPVLRSPFVSAPSLFSGAGRKDVNSTLTHPGDTSIYKDRGLYGPPLSSGGAALSPGSRPETRWGEEHPASLLASEPVGGGCSAPPFWGAAQNLRSKAQILALLRAKSSSTSNEVNSAVTGQLPRGESQGTVKIPPHAGCLAEQGERAEGSTRSFQHQQPAGNAARNNSRWAVYLSSQSPPARPPPVDGRGLEGKPTASAEDRNVRLRGFLVQKRVPFFETHVENGKKYTEDKLVGDTDPPWDWEGRLETPSFRGSSSLPVSCGSVGKEGLVSKCGVEENVQIPVSQRDRMCADGSLTREDAQELSACGVPEKEREQTGSLLPGNGPRRVESPLRSNSRISDACADVSSRRNADHESLGTQAPMRNFTQPFLEVNFNLSNFEASDTEEESQGSTSPSQGPKGGETSAGDCDAGVGRSREAARSGEGGGAPPPLSPPAASKPAGTVPAEKAEPAQPWGRAGPPGGGGRWSDPTVEPTGDVHVGSEGVNTPIQEVGSTGHFDSLPNKSKSMNSNVHIPHFFNIDTNETLESRLLPRQAQQQQPFITGSDFHEHGDQSLPSPSGRDRVLHAGQSQAGVRLACEELDPQVCKSLFHPLRGGQTVSGDTETRNLESGDGGVPGGPQGCVEGGSAGENRRSWRSPRDSSEPSGLGNSLFVLKSLSEHTTALEGLETLRKENAAFEPLCTREPGSRPEGSSFLPSMATALFPVQVPSPCAGSEPRSCSAHHGASWLLPRVATSKEQIPGQPLGTVVSPAAPDQDSQQCPSPMTTKAGGAEAGEPLQLFPLGSEEEPAFPAVPPEHTERRAWDPQFPEEEKFPEGGDRFYVEDNFQVMAVFNKDSIEKDSILDFPSKESEVSYHYLDYNFKSAEKTSWEANKVMSPEQEAATLSPVSAFSLDLRGEDFKAASSEESLQARTSQLMKKFSAQESQNLQSRTRVPLVTVPTADVPPAAASGPWAATWGPPGLPLLSSGPEDRSKASSCLGSRPVAPGAASLRPPKPAPSKWLKYQNTAPSDLPTPSGAESSGQDGVAEVASGSPCAAVGGRPWASARRQVLGGQLQDSVCGDTALPPRVRPASETGCRQGEPQGSACGHHSGTASQEINVSELHFPSGRKIKSMSLPRRQSHIPVVFQSPTHYKQVLTSCLTEHLNIMLFGLAQRLHRALSLVDVSFYMSTDQKLETDQSNVPSCHHHQPARLVMVKKEGPNKGRLFYTCDAAKADRCRFFKWLEEVSSGHLTQEEPPPSTVLSDIKSIGLYLRSQQVPLYEECQLLVRKGLDFQSKQYGKRKKFMTVNPEFYNEPKSRLYLKLSRKESSSTYNKDDLWVVSRTLDFELDTFLACSASFGPSSASKVELLPVQGFFPSRWPTDTVVHALLVGNASTELTTLKNIQDLNPTTLPLMQHLLTMSPSAVVSSRRGDRRRFTPPASCSPSVDGGLPSLAAALHLAGELIRAHGLNEDQAAALTQVARMVASHGGAEEVGAPRTCSPPITLIHGVFGAGKSYLLAVVILFFVQLFEKSESPTVGNPRPWRLLVSSSTNVAVDRVLLGLLSLGFEKFVRVGSVRKIAKPILPYRLHTGSDSASEQLGELHALLREDPTPGHGAHVRTSVRQHRLGTSRTLLRQVCVVGATCAACGSPCTDGLRFPVVLLDECSQMTEPASLLPVARFGCERLILVGDPRQLPPTIQGSDPAHGHGLEQTLFDRLCLMGHKPVMLRTQYRCHPAIAAVANGLFYGGSLRSGVQEAERRPLLAGLPTLCFYNVLGQEQVGGSSSFHNAVEAAFTLKLLRSLSAGGVAGSAIGVVTLYRSQMCKLRHLLRAVALDHPSLQAVQVSTVDAFQGAEKEVVILSCVRTRDVGFIDSERRVNVALTRARRHLLVVGSLACLRRNRLWGRVIQHCEGREDGLQHASQCESQLDQLLRAPAGQRAERTRSRRGRGAPLPGQVAFPRRWGVGPSSGQRLGALHPVMTPTLVSRNSRSGCKTCCSEKYTLLIVRLADVEGNRKVSLIKAIFL